MSYLVIVLLSLILLIFFLFINQKRGELECKSILSTNIILSEYFVVKDVFIILIFIFIPYFNMITFIALIVYVLNEIFAYCNLLNIRKENNIIKNFSTYVFNEFTIFFRKVKSLTLWTKNP